MTGKPPTQQGISALLRKAGFEKSAASPTGVKGVRIRSAGYTASGPYPGIVWVSHETASLQPHPQDQGRIASAHAAYATAIEAAGYAVERRADRLVVTAKTEEN